jgi:hypothetical protein
LADALGSFPAANYNEDKKVTDSERSRISYLAALTGATYVVLPKENHMQLAEATTLDRKSGGAEGPAVLRTSPGNAEYDVQTDFSSAAMTHTRVEREMTSLFTKHQFFGWPIQALFWLEWASTPAHFHGSFAHESF